MSKEISRRYRPEHRDVEVILEDAHGTRSRVYIGMGERCHACGHPLSTGASGEIDVDGIVREHMTRLDSDSERISKVLKKAKLIQP